MFSSYSDFSYTPSASGEKRRIDPGIGTFVVLVKLRGNNNDHISSHIFQNAGLYVKSIHTLTNANYQSNTSISIEPAESGTAGFYVAVNYTSIYGAVTVNVFKLR